MAAEHRTVSRVLGILEGVARARGPVSLTTLTRDLDAPKSSLHGLAGGLLQRGYLVEVPGGYRLGAGAHALLLPAGTSLPLLLGESCAEIALRTRFLRELDDIRESGMAFNREETVEDVGAVAVGVHEAGHLSAGITIAGPHSRVADRLEYFGRLAQDVLDADGFGRRATA